MASHDQTSGQTSGQTNDQTSGQTSSQTSGQTSGQTAGRVSVPDDPFELLEINDRHRCYTTDGEFLGPDVCSVDMYVASTPEPAFCVPTVFPPRWCGGPPRLSSERVRAAFRAHLGYATASLCGAHIVAAGGAVAWALVGNTDDENTHPADVDLFVVGVPPDDAAQLWAVAGAAATSAAGRLAEHPHVLTVTQTIMRGLVDVAGYDGGGALVARVQIILRAFPSVSSLLHGFDLPASCVAFDGKTAYTTTFGAYAALRGCNIVVPAYRSTTYERRLEKYAARGYATSFPHMSRRALEGRTVTLRWCDITLERPAASGGPPHAVGAVRARRYSDSSDDDDDTVAESVPACDYCRPPGEMADEFISGRGNYRVTTSVRVGGGRRFEALVDDFGAFAASHTLADIVEREQIVRSLAVQVNRHVAVVRRAATPRAGGCRRAAVKDLRRWAVQTLRRYDAEADRPIAWWYTHDPSRQYTASFNPRVEDPADWYCLFLDVGAAAGPLAVVGAAGVGRAPAHVYNEECPLCQDPIAVSDANTVFMKCGHICHWAADGDCLGLYRMFVLNKLSGGADSCPICRDAFGDAPARARPASGPRPATTGAQDEIERLVAAASLEDDYGDAEPSGVGRLWQREDAE
jgi:hypothetical protein